MTDPTLAERMAAFSAEHGAPATFAAAGGGDPGDYDPLTDSWSNGDAAGASFTTDVFEDDPEDDDFRDGTVIAENPVILLVPNSPAVTFPPEKGQRVAYMGTTYSVAAVRPFVFDAAVQLWRVIGGV